MTLRNLVFIFISYQIEFVHPHSSYEVISRDIQFIPTLETLRFHSNNFTSDHGRVIVWCQT